VTVQDHFPWAPPAAWTAVGGPPHWSIWSIAETGSTNTDLVAAAADGAPDRSVLVAGHQTAGRGRLGRRWDAPPGANLLVSILFRAVPEPAVELTHRVALAAIAAARVVAGVDARLKWPNDVLLDGRKLAGILAQRADDTVVVGVGLNVRWAPDGAALLGPDPAPVTVLGELLNQYDALPDDISAPYRAALATLGAAVRVELPGSVVEGRAVDVDPDGRLVVIDACAVTHHVDAGDVVHLRPADDTGG
jgi:BirA family transcriptional regulator, biotin operon repressor / biotin---[acetyl-CoA-carboxylase] ligase